MAKELSIDKTNKSDFSREFRQTTDAAEFVQKFQELTVFDRVQGIVLTNLVGNLESQPDEPADGNSTDSEIHQDEPGDHPPPAKKPKKSDNLEMGKAIDEKKVGEFVVEI